MNRMIYFAALAALVFAPFSASASQCGRPASGDLVPRAVDSLYILQSAVGSRHCRLEDCDVNSDCRISVSDALDTLRSAVGEDDMELDCRSECPTVVPCGREDAPMCNGTCPADQACMPASDDDDSDRDERVTVCHFPPGNPSNAHTLVVGESSISAHLRHGDELGPCEDLGLGSAMLTRHRDRDEKGDSDSDSDSDSDTGGDDGDGGGGGGGGIVGSAAAGQDLYDTRCQFCHSAGSHDTEPGPGGQIAGEGDEMTNDLGRLDRQMMGILLTDQEVADLRAFLATLSKEGPGEANCVCVPVTITTTTTMAPPTTTTMAPPTTTTMAPPTTTTMAPPTTTTMAPTTTTTMAPTTTTTTTMAPTTTTTTTTTMGPSIAAGQAIYDARCGFCHSAGAHDPTDGPGGPLARKGGLLVNDLGMISRQMTGLTLTDKEIADLAAFLNSL